MDFQSDVRQWLQGLAFPAWKREVVNYAREQGAPGFLMLALANLPRRKYTSVSDVAEHLTTTGPDITTMETPETA
jgi:hypothetical protein